MSPGKYRIRLTYDNVDDHIGVSDPEGLVGRLNIGPGGVTPHGRAVAEFFTWLDARNVGSSTVEYYCTPSAAALILERLAGVRHD